MDKEKIISLLEKSVRKTPIKESKNNNKLQFFNLKKLEKSNIDILLSYSGYWIFTGQFEFLKTSYIIISHKPTNQKFQVFYTVNRFGNCYKGYSYYGFKIILVKNVSQ